MARSVADEKKYLRAVLSECRDAIPAEIAKALSGAIQQRLIASDAYRSAGQLVLYAPRNNEVSTDLIFADAVASGRSVFFPRYERERKSIVAAYVDSLSDLKPGSFGVNEPCADARVASSHELADAIICVPGLGFGPEGQRLGRGGGHYDRFLWGLAPESITAGLAYSFQLLDRIPESPSDRRLKLIVTEYALLQASDWSEASGAARTRGGRPGWN